MSTRVDLRSRRLQATLAVIRGPVTSGLMVPLKNISPTGAGVYTKLAISPHTAVRLAIENIEHLPLEGKVARCETLVGDPTAPPTHPYFISIDFIFRSDTERLHAFETFEAVCKLVES